MRTFVFVPGSDMPRDSQYGITEVAPAFFVLAETEEVALDRFHDVIGPDLGVDILSGYLIYELSVGKKIRFRLTAEYQ